MIEQALETAALMLGDDKARVLRGLSSPCEHREQIARDDAVRSVPTVSALAGRFEKQILRGSTQLPMSTLRPKTSAPATGPNGIRRASPAGPDPRLLALSAVWSFR
jgi:hypothetical protein